MIVENGYVGTDGSARGDAFVGRRFTVANPQVPKPPPGLAEINAIADPMGAFSGLYWSCDELPPATYALFV